MMGIIISFANAASTCRTMWKLRLTIFSKCWRTSLMEKFLTVVPYLLIMTFLHPYGICNNYICFASFLRISIKFAQKGLATSALSVLFRISTAAFMESHKSVASVPNSLTQRFGNLYERRVAIFLPLQCFSSAEVSFQQHSSRSSSLPASVHLPCQPSLKLCWY